MQSGYSNIIASFSLSEHRGVLLLTATPPYPIPQKAGPGWSMSSDRAWFGVWFLGSHLGEVLSSSAAGGQGGGIGWWEEQLWLRKQLDGVPISIQQLTDRLATKRTRVPSLGSLTTKDPTLP